MSLDGLRAWIGEVERKLGMRTRVFLVLTVIAVGIGGAAIYLAIDARDSAVSESDVQALQEDLEAQIGSAGGGAEATQVTQLEAELDALRAEVERLEGAGGKGSSDGGASSGGGDASDGAAEGAGTGADGGDGNAATPGGASGAKLRELLEQAKAQSAQAEEDQAGK